MKGRKEKERREKAISRDKWFKGQFDIYKQCSVQWKEKRLGECVEFIRFLCDIFIRHKEQSKPLSEKDVTQVDCSVMFQASYFSAYISFLLDYCRYLKTHYITLV